MKNPFKTHFRRAATRQHGFTMIELLVVITIIALLAALSVPIVGNALQRARYTEKLSNLRQIWTAHELYMNDHDGRVVPVRDQTVDWREGSNWRIALVPYLGVGDNLTADEMNRLSVFVDPFFEGYDPNSPGSSGYAMNVRPGLPDNNKSNVHWNATPQQFEQKFKMVALKSLQNRIFLADASTSYWFNETNADSTLDMTRHDGKGMVLMYDGSTRLLTLDQAVAAAEDPTTLDEIPQ